MIICEEQSWPSAESIIWKSLWSVNFYKYKNRIARYMDTKHVLNFDKQQISAYLLYISQLHWDV